MKTIRNDIEGMSLALEVCRAGVEAGQSPFGAAIVREGQVLAVAHNHVWQWTDPTAHAEVTAIRQACQGCGQVHLSGATIYSTTEPCAMCFAAIHWARIGRIVFAARVEDAARYGFNELPMGNAQLKSLGRLEVELVGDFQRDLALALFDLFKARHGRTY